MWIIFFFGERNDNLQTKLSNKKLVLQLSMILAVKSKLAVSLVKAIVFPFVGVYLTVICVPYTQVFRRGGGGVGEGVAY